MTKTASHNTIITPKQAGTLDGLFYERTRRSADEIAYIQYNKENCSWENTTWNEMAVLVGQWQKAISQEELEAGDRVAILMKNSKEWVAVDQAALGLGLVIVPLYLEDRPDNIAYILEDSAIKLLVVQDTSQWGRLRDKCVDNKMLQRVILIDAQADELEDDSKLVTTMFDWLPEQGHVLHKRNGDTNELATIVYTSGTTGRPKGVMLSHSNILSIAYPSAEELKVKADDLFLSFLPMSHTFERSLGYYLTVMVGCQVAFARSIQLLADDLISIKPTLLISVPRIYERIYGKIESTLLTGSPVKRLLFKLTIQIGWNRFLYQQKRSAFCLSCFI